MNADQLVPSANVPALPSLGFSFQAAFSIEGQQKFDPQFGAFQKPEGAPSMLRFLGCHARPPAADERELETMIFEARFGSAGHLISAPMEHSVVPQQSNGLPYRLSTIERQELELARRRAEKAAEGKRANAAQARAKRRASRPRLEDRQGEQAEGGDGSNDEEDDLEAKLANTKDEKEAKRLRR